MSRGLGRSPVGAKAAVHVVRIEELVLRAVEEPGEPAAVSGGHADDEELLGKERVKVVGGDDVQVDGELGVGPGPELGAVQVRVTGVLGTRAKPGDDCKERECSGHHVDQGE